MILPGRLLLCICIHINGWILDICFRNSFFYYVTLSWKSIYFYTITIASSLKCYENDNFPKVISCNVTSSFYTVITILNTRKSLTQIVRIVYYGEQKVREKIVMFFFLTISFDIRMPYIVSMYKDYLYTLEGRTYLLSYTSQICHYVLFGCFSFHNCCFPLFFLSVSFNLIDVSLKQGRIFKMQ